MGSRFVLAVSALLFGTMTSAEARPDTRDMTCRQAQQLVAQNGAVVMTTGPHTFRRFVHSYAFCQVQEQLAIEPAPTADTARCPVGYRCVPESDIFEGDLFR